MGVIISKDFSLIQYMGKSYNVPTSPDLRENLGKLKDVIDEKMNLRSKIGGPDVESYYSARICVAWDRFGGSGNEIYSCKYFKV